MARPGRTFRRTRFHLRRRLASATSPFVAGFARLQPAGTHRERRPAGPNSFPPSPPSWSSWTCRSSRRLEIRHHVRSARRPQLSPSWHCSTMFWGPRSSLASPKLVQIPLASRSRVVQKLERSGHAALRSRSSTFRQGEHCSRSGCYRRAAARARTAVDFPDLDDCALGGSAQHISERRGVEMPAQRRSFDLGIHL